MYFFFVLCCIVFYRFCFFCFFFFKQKTAYEIRLSLVGSEMCIRDSKRMGLYDVAMVKDNHKLAAGSVAGAYAAVRSTFPDVDVQVEVTTVAEAVEAVAAGARFLLLDNMEPPLLRE